MAVRNKLFDWGIKTVKKLPVPVISVGNLTIGGTGKTPLVIYIAEMLQSIGIKPAVVSRGYGGRRDGSKINIVSDGKVRLLDEEMAGDEASLLAVKLRGVPVLVGNDRFMLGRYAIDVLGAEAIILDDGFQHRQLHRDINICVVQSSRGLGNGLPLPSGPLREFASAIGRADIIVFTNTPDGDDTAIKVDEARWKKLNKPLLEAFYTPIALIKNGETFSLDFMRDKKVCAFCGIGNPNNFRKTIERLGASYISFIAYPDHHRYDENNINQIRESAQRADIEIIITTEKDAVKIKKFTSFFEGIFVLPIAIVPEATNNVLRDAIYQATANKK